MYSKTLSGNVYDAFLYLDDALNVIDDDLDEAYECCNYAYVLLGNALVEFENIKEVKK